MTTANVQSNGRGVRYVAPTLGVSIQPPDAGRTKDEPTFPIAAGPETWWTPQKLEWGINGRMTTLTMRRQLGRGPGRDAQESVEAAARQIGPGHRVRLAQAMLFSRSWTESLRPGHLEASSLRFSPLEH